MFRLKNISTIFIVMLIFITFTAACISRRGGTDIIDITWQWVSLSEYEPASQSVVPDFRELHNYSQLGWNNEYQSRLQYGEWFIYD